MKFDAVPTEDSADEENIRVDNQCGIGRFKPKWLQRFADPKIYLVIFCIVGVLEGAYFTYFVGVLSTLEKRFAFDSKVSGVILIADSISATVISLIVGYYGGKAHKPRMIAIGMVLVSVSCFMSTLPYFIYGPALHFLTRDFGSEQKKLEFCDSDITKEECSGKANNSTVPTVAILFLANLLCGFGYTAYYTIGAPYLDDNVKKKNSPMYFKCIPFACTDNSFQCFPHWYQMESKFEPVPASESEASIKEFNEEIKYPEYQCGIGKFKPKWLQRFADPKVYLVIFCTVGVLEGAYFTYFVGVMTTLEKRFAFESKISGLIFIADNISATIISLIVGYYGQKWHKPRVIAFGMVMVSISCLICTIPYFVYGPALHFLTREIHVSGNKKQEFCADEIQEEDCKNNATDSSRIPVIVILFFANFLWGFGYTAYYTIGAPYLDDNVKKKNAPMYFSRYRVLYCYGDKILIKVVIVYHITVL
ncbi:solute carrier organic anion transporter family member 4A1 [Nephila pilipes]|uniref:Solute carrier organic anion transporter family member 4A1 n=1 Tax=Nephila pilipes TaxID=299642 RepID=A0A8X6TIV4_NEPPI|nr:solute carrier organic anion transporter family member 4A1 [Nephila pilipes]